MKKKNMTDEEHLQDALDAQDRELRRVSGKSECSGSVPTSDGLLEMWMERDPAKWAAHQIAAKGYKCETVGEAMDMIEAIVRKAMEMEQNDTDDSRKTTGD